MDQLMEAYGWQAAPRYILRDRDAVYGEIFVRRLRAIQVLEWIGTPAARRLLQTPAKGAPLALAWQGAARRAEMPLIQAALHEGQTASANHRC